MCKQLIKVLDFRLFCEVIKAATKIVDSAKIIIGQSGLEIYGARPNRTARCELVSNAVSSDSQIEFSIEKLSQFLRIVQTVKDEHEDDFTGLKFIVDLPFIRFESKKFKTKYSTCNEILIKDWVSKKISTELTSVFEFTTNSDMIKRLNSHSFLFTDPKDVRLYLETREVMKDTGEMENNVVFATLGNKETNLNNEITFKFGLVNSGSLAEKDEGGAVVKERKIIIDLERLNYFNAIYSDSIKLSLMNVNCLVSRTHLTGAENDTFFNATVYGTLLKN